MSEYFYIGLALGIVVVLFVLISDKNKTNYDISEINDTFSDIIRFVTEYQYYRETLEDYDKRGFHKDSLTRGFYYDTKDRIDELEDQVTYICFCISNLQTKEEIEMIREEIENIRSYKSVYSSLNNALRKQARKIK